MLRSYCGQLGDGDRETRESGVRKGKQRNRDKETEPQIERESHTVTAIRPGRHMRSETERSLAKSIILGKSLKCYYCNDGQKPGPLITGICTTCKWDQVTTLPTTNSRSVRSSSAGDRPERVLLAQVGALQIALGVARVLRGQMS